MHLNTKHIPLSLYIHLPWCIKKCPYCDFNSHEIQQTVPEEQYIDALIADLTFHANDVHGRELISIFIGGGTPSIFSASSIKRLLGTIDELLILSKHIEITIEANPGTMDQENFSGFREAGVNRISIGVQSFSDQQLLKLGRIHDAQAAIDSVHAAKQAGFENINLDLMYALPQQDLKTALNDVEQAIALNPTHISYYQLTLEPNTAFYRQPPVLPDTQTSWKIQQAGMQLLADHSYSQYEVSAYAKDDYTCKHNQNYWRFGDYLGIGAGAHQKLSFSSTNSIVRCEKPKHPQQYMRSIRDKKPITETYSLNKQDIIFEFMLNALRLKHGFSQAQFEAHTGLAFQTIDENLQTHIDEGLLVMENNTVHCSERGYRFLDELLQKWLPDTQHHAA